MQGEPSKWLTENLEPELLDSPLFRFSFTGPNGLQISVDLSRDLDIDYERLEHLLETIPAQYVFWASVYSELRGQVALCENRITRRRATLTKALRRNAQTTGVRVTDKQLLSLIDGDDVDEVAVARTVAARYLQDNLSNEEIEARIKEEIAKERRETLTYLEMQLVVANRNCGKVFHMVKAIEMRSDHCRSLAGFKRQEHTQAGSMT